MRLLRAAATALVAVLALSSCNSSSSGEPKTTTKPSGSSSAPSSPPPTAKPTEPPLPTAATKATEAGARAFITYYWDLINYAQVTGDVETLKAVSGPNCAGCNAGIKAIDDVYAADGHISDAHYRASVTKVSELEAQTSELYAFKATLDVEHDDHVFVSVDGTQKPYAAATRTYSAYILWVNDHWRLDVMESK